LEGLARHELEVEVESFCPADVSAESLEVKQLEVLEPEALELEEEHALELQVSHMLPFPHRRPLAV